MFHVIWVWVVDQLAKWTAGQHPVQQLLSQMSGAEAKASGWFINPVTLYPLVCGIIATAIVFVRRRLGGK